MKTALVPRESTAEAGAIGIFPQTQKMKYALLSKD